MDIHVSDSSLIAIYKRLKISRSSLQINERKYETMHYLDAN